MAVNPPPPEPDPSPPSDGVAADLSWWRRLTLRSGLLSAFKKIRLQWHNRPLRGNKAGRHKEGNMLPLLIEALAGFTKLDGEVDELEIESSLGYLRYDYPEAIYADLRRLYLEALRTPQDLNQRARELSRTLSMEQKILLCVQLYLLISKAASNQRQMVEFYLFMTNMGIAAQAIDIVYQLNQGKQPTDEDFVPPTGHPLERLRICSQADADVLLRSLPENCAITAFRFETLVLVKNTGQIPVLVRSRRLLPNEFSRIYPGERLVLEDVSLDYADLSSYFNAKKTLGGTQLYLTFTSTGDAEIAPTRNRNTSLRVSFGLSVTVEALRNTAATINHQPLHQGTIIQASIEDSIILSREVEISLSDLRRRAQEFGNQFRLAGTRNTYLVSNNPALLAEGDILLSESTEGQILLRIECNYAQKTGRLEVLQAARPVFVNELPVREQIELTDGATITLGEGQYLRCHFGDRIIEEERNIIRKIEVRELTHRFDARTPALEGVSFQARRGEMICVMGPSGCGKSTLLRTLAAQLKPRHGEILMNGLPLYDNIQTLSPYIAYIPQEDAFDPLLTVQENLDCSVAIRCPHLHADDRRRRVDAKLSELGLSDLRQRISGTPQQKHLSGGERKRLNAGLDMIGISDVYLFDEPTSGLSSKDSEHVLEIIQSLARNKIVIASIHQPSSRLLGMFDKALLLDKGGKMVFFGPPQEMLTYFWRAYQDEAGILGSTEVAPDNLTPDFVFDVLETPLRDISGVIIQERNPDGHLVAARRFSPNFWRDRFQSHLMLESYSRSASHPLDQDPAASQQSSLTRGRKSPAKPELSLRDESILFVTHLKRAFLSKLRNRTNVLATLLEAPALALLISSVLKYSEETKYTFTSAFHIPTYLFMSLVVAMFLGLTNSSDEIIRDRHMLNRERNHNQRTLYYIFAKVLSLATFALIQCFIYLWIGNWMLEILDMFLIHLAWMFVTSLIGVCLGLLVSSLVNDIRTALNAIPLILIPQIILGGALIKYEEMNRNLDLAYAVERWSKIKQPDAEENPPSKLRVPFICQFMPLRWSYEAMIISQAKLNPLTRTQDLLEERIQELVNLPPSVPFTDQQKQELDLTKQALAAVSGLYGRRGREVATTLQRIGNAALERRLTQELIDSVTELRKGTSAEEIYVNRKVLDLVTKAEMEREDHRKKQSPNVFFGTVKRYIGTDFRTLWINSIVVAISLLLILTALELSLRRQLTRV